MKKIVKCHLCGWDIDIKTDRYFTVEILSKKEILCLSDGEYISAFLKQFSEMQEVIPTKEELS